MVPPAVAGFVMACAVWLGSGLAGQETGGGSRQETAASEQQTAAPDAAVLFHEKGCEYCHGVAGRGTERGPSLLGVGKKLSTARISSQIHEGGGAMPAFGEVLTGPEIESLIHYLQTLKGAPAVKRKTAAKKPGDAAQ